MNPAYWQQMDSWGKREGWTITAFSCSVRRFVVVAFVTTHNTEVLKDGAQIGMCLN